MIPNPHSGSMIFYHYVVLTFLLLLSPLAGKGQPIPADEDVKDPSLLSLGPIGVRVSMDHREDRQPRSKSNSATIRYIFTNSLAEKRLKIGDVIEGINGNTFNENFSAKVAEEIDKAEGEGGEITLQINREGTKIDIPLELDTIGSYSKTWPHQCEKSSQILYNACDWLVEHQQKNGRLEKNKGSPHFVLTSTAGLAMLGCDPKKYKRPLAKITTFLCDTLKENRDEEGHYHNGPLELWSLNYAAIFLSEYYLITKDEKSLSALKFLNREIHHRQFHQADKETVEHVKALRKRRGDRGEPVPPYWFAHGKLSTKTSGYVHLGANTAYACLAWNLMKKAGVDVDVENLNATMDYIEEAGPIGYMPYSGIPNQRDRPNDAFGRTGTLSMVLYLDGGRADYSKLVNESMANLYPKATYFSHATCVMGKAWGMMSIAHQNPSLFRKMMNECRHDFDLLRLSDGSFVSNPVTKNHHGRLDLVTGGNGDKHRWTTAFNALIYALGQKRLTITGAQ